MYKGLSGIMVVSVCHPTVAMAKKPTGGKVDWLRQMREKQFDESTRHVPERTGTEARGDGPSKSNKGRRPKRSVDQPT